ncbi:MAG: hypothetical protein HQM07_05895 [Zetaproteobacteria bacterium]|nr:hypothetical protein [Zetaproteobacteria bacterium]
MKNVFFSVAASLMFVANAYAIDKTTYVSEADSIFCFLKSDAVKFQKFMLVRDSQAAGKMIQSEACQIVKPSLVFYIENQEGDIAEVRRKGMTDSLFTFKHQLRRQ